MRTNRKTRIKGLPPKIQLQMKDAVTGSFPTVARLSSDNRTGIYSTFWDDNNTINFGPRDDIRNSIINYYRFNSGSLYAEVFPLGISAGTSSYTIKPVWSTNSPRPDFKNYDNINLHFQMHSTGSFSGFVSSSIPFSGTSGDINITSLKLSGSEYSFATGSLSVFNPGKDTAITGSLEKSFSIVFWTKVTGGAPTGPQVIVSVGEPAASWPGFAFSTTNASLVIASNKIGNLQFLISDASNNGLVLSTSNAVLTPDNWKHVACTYNGRGTRSDLQLYIDGQFVTTGNKSQGFPESYSGIQTNAATTIVSVGSLGKRLNNNFNGEIDELIFFNEALDAGTINNLYRSTAGIYYPNPGNPFINGTYLGAGISTKSQYFSNSNIADLITDFSTSLYQSSGSRVVKGIGDNLAHFTPGQSLKPFNDSGNFAADGKSRNNLFFATGSSPQLVGEGFDEPLWSKSKIEINLSANTSMSLGENLGPVTGSDFLMAYYNFASQSWNPVGAAAQTTTFISQTLATPGSGITNYFRQKAIGFAGLQSMTLANGLAYPVNGIRTISEFGFPFDGKYFVSKTGTSSSILMPMSNSINAPFLLEKIVLEFTGALNSSDTVGEWSGGATGFLSTFFFILNQRNGGFVSQSITLNPSPDSFPANVTASYSVFHTSGTMDLVATLPIFSPGTPESIWNVELTGGINGTTPDTENYLKRNKNTTFIFPDSSVHTNGILKWSGRYTISGAVCSPSTLVPPADNFGYIKINIRSGSNTTDVYRVNGSFPINRNGTSQLTSPRSFRNPAIGAVQTPINDSFSGTTFAGNSSAWIVNPYILQPTDNLIFGWQAPYNGNYYEQQVPDSIPVLQFTGSARTMPQFTIAAGPSKIILYGSYIKENKEHNDTLNQLLISNVAHEVIG